MRTPLVLIVALAAAACASAPPAPPAPAAPTFEQKMSWILRLEDQRQLHDPAPPVVPAPPATRQRGAPAIVPQPPVPDLLRLLSDEEARVRRRAALAVGHVGLPEGVDPLVRLLAGDPEPEVRQMAAFALGLIGDKRARDPLVAALADPSPLVQGSAAQALGLIGDPAAAAPLGQLAAKLVDSGALAQVPGDDVEARRDLPASVFRLAVDALVQLKAYDPLASAVLDRSGTPRVAWWPVAYALGRLADHRALAPLVALTKDPQPYTRAFAARGLGALKDPAAVPALIPLIGAPDRSVAIEAVRALGNIGDRSAAPAIAKLVNGTDVDPQLRLEALIAAGQVHATGATDVLLDSLSDPSPTIRAAALRSLADFDQTQFVAVLSGLDPDQNWTVRSTLASVLGRLDPAVAVPRLEAMLADRDQRVIPAVLRSLVRLHPPDVATVLFAHLKADDIAVREAAAEGVGALKPPKGDQALADAYALGDRDASFEARAAALDALAKYGAGAATPVLRTALADKDWAVRLKAAMLLKQFEPASAAGIDQQIRPAPTNLEATAYDAAQLTMPPVSTQVYLDTDRGSIQIELAVLDAPLTVQNFITLARKGFYNGLSVHRVVPDFVVQSGDPRGDGDGGPGYSIRDEINERPFLRGTLGMALDSWPDTGGSQFFITHSPQPQLDARYTVFGRVVSGMDVVDAIQPGDVIRRVRVWDGQTMTGR